MPRERVVVPDIAAEVREILVFHLGSDRAKVTNDARLADDLGADSLDVVEVVMSFEERFDIEIPNNVATRLVTGGDAVAFISAQVAEGAAAEPGPQPAQPHLVAG